MCGGRQNCKWLSPTARPSRPAAHLGYRILNKPPQCLNYEKLVAANISHSFLLVLLLYEILKIDFNFRLGKLT